AEGRLRGRDAGGRDCVGRDGDPRRGYRPMSESLAELVAAVRTSQGGVRARAAGRLMTLVVDRPELVHDLSAAANNSNLRPRRVIGITGPPGAGKSTLVDALLTRLLSADRAR